MIDRPQTPCRMWAGNTDKDGYGTTYRPGRGKVRVARATWEDAHGPLPAGVLICHSCDTPGCYELSHLFPGTPAANSADMVAKGRQPHMAGSRNGQAKLTPEQVAEIRATVKPLGAGKGKGGLRAAARRYGVSIGTISPLLAGKTWRA